MKSNLSPAFELSITTIVRITLLASIVLTMNSCSADDTDSSNTAKTTANSIALKEYSYNSIEIETLNLINTYRASKGLNTLKPIAHISFKSEEHNNNMIASNLISHSGFVARSENIMKVLGATNVAENLACNYKTAQSVFDAWLNSPVHKENIVGNYTHFGISIKVDSSTNKNYFTNMFAKI